MAFEVKRLRVEIEDTTGRSDEFAEAIITDEGFFLTGFFMDSDVGMSWGHLARFLRDPDVQRRVDEADMDIPEERENRT
jgi:hypothetical protein